MEMTQYKLGDLCRIASAKRIFENEYVDFGIPFVRGQEISDGSLLDQNSVFDCYISKERYEEIKQKYGKPSKGDILITAVGTIGNLCYLDKDIDFYFKDGNVIWFSDIKDFCCGLYLYHFMKGSFFKDQLKYYMIGAVQKALTMDMLKKVNVPLPPLSEQKKIASVLSALDDKIALNKKMNQKLEAMAKRLYDYWFVQFDFPDENGCPYKTTGGPMIHNPTLNREIPAGWEVAPLKSCIKHINTGLNPRDNFVLGNGDIKYVTVKNLTTEGNIDFSGCDFIDEEALKKVHKRSDIAKGDVLYASICPLGRSFLINKDPEGWDINESVFSIRPCHDVISSEFLSMYLKDSAVVEKASKMATGSIFKGIRIKELENMILAVPPKKIMEVFSTQIKNLIDLEHKNMEQISRLIILRDKLLPLLMNGQVTIR